MEAFGTWNGRRVALRLNRRDGSIVIVDDASGEVLARNEGGTPNAFVLDGRVVRWGASVLMLDPGEEGVAAGMLRPAGGAPWTARPPAPGSASIEDQRIFEEEVHLEVLRQGAMASARRATAAANVVTFVLVAGGILMAIAGVVMMTQRERSYSGWDRPYLGSGVALLAVGVAQVSFGLMLSFGVSSVAQYIHYRSERDALDS